MRNVILGGVAAAVWLLAPTLALAHPHVWVRSISTVVFDKAASVVAIRHAWTFDDMFSSYAVQGLDADGDGKLTREELQPLAETNVTAMAESEFFTFADTQDGEVVFGKPSDYWLSFDGIELTLHFTLALKAPVKQGGSITFEINDPTFFVDFQLADKDPIMFVGAPKGCSAEVKRPTGDVPQPGSEAAMSDMFANTGADFANRVVVRCPS